MNPFGPDAAALVASVSNITGLRLGLRTRGEHEVALTCKDVLTTEQEHALASIETFLRRHIDAGATILRLERELRDLQERNEALSRSNSALAEMATRDILTGLYTRWFVCDKIDQELERSRRHHAPMSVLMVDVDHFKKVNDVHGHIVGDEVLREMGRLIRESLRAYDVPGRYGGEEFCLLLPSTPVDKTLAVAERLRARIEDNQLVLPEGRVRVTASIGVAGTDAGNPHANAADLITLADRALYRAKGGGRNRVEVADH